MRFYLIFTLVCLVGVAHSWGRDMVQRPQSFQDEYLQQIQRMRRFQQLQQLQQIQQAHQQHQQLQQQLSAMQQVAIKKHWSLLKNAQCFGLARRTRPQKVEVPILYNVRTKETAPIPRFLYTAGQNLITKMENDGWEVRTRVTLVPHVVYERVPICCPWDTECIQNGGVAVPKSQKPMVPSPAANSPCANGGQLIYKDGQQKCECPHGYQGAWCQTPDVVGRMRVTATQGPFADMVREAEQWRRQIFQNRLNNVAQSDPMLSPRDHLIASMAGPWAQRAAVWHQQAMKQRMSEQWAQAVQGAASPYEAMLAMQRSGGNPYSVLDPRARGQRNPYNEMPSQGQLPPNMQSAVYAIQQEIRQGNPYSQQQVDPRIAAVLKMNNDRRPMGTRPTYGMRPPQARTPWDLDPFNQQVPGYMKDPRQGPQTNDPRQLMAMAMYQRMMAQNGPPAMGRPPMGVPSGGPLGMSRPSEGQMSPMPAPPSNNDNEQVNEEDTMVQAQAPALAQNQPAEPAQEQPMESMPGVGPALHVTGNGNGIHVSGGGMSMPPRAQRGPMTPPMGQQGPMMPTMGQQGPMTPPMGQQGPMMPPVGQQRPMIPPMGQQGPMGAQMPGGGPEFQVPTPEELEKIKSCQGVLQPKLNNCIKESRDLTLEQFLNPEFMETAKGICGDSDRVGACMMKLDTACGENSVMTTRKMLNSVLQMMGLVCEQIMARGNAQIPPLQDTQLPGPAQETPLEQQSQPEGPAEDLSRQEPGPAVVEDPSVFSPSADEGDEGGMSKTGKISASDEVTQPTHAASMGGHNLARRISKELEVMGLPLWLGICILIVSFIVVFILLMVACICIRRCKNKKSVDKEIEKLPEPLDNSKLYTVGIPPPSYTTTAVKQTEDGLSLPPLDLNEEDAASVTVVDEKPPLDDDDADDESDDKEETGSIKKKKEKKGDH